MGLVTPGLGVVGDAVVGVDLEAAVFPRVEDLGAFRREEFLLNQEVDDLKGGRNNVFPYLAFGGRAGP